MEMIIRRLGNCKKASSFDALEISALAKIWNNNKTATNL